MSANAILKISEEYSSKDLLSCSMVSERIPYSAEKKRRSKRRVTTARDSASSASKPVKPNYPNVPNSCSDAYRKATSTGDTPASVLLAHLSHVKASNPSSSPMMTSAMTSRSRNDVVHRSPTLIHILIPTIAPTTIYTPTFTMSQPLKTGQQVSCVFAQFAVVVEEVRTLNCEMTDGNGVAAMSREKLTKSYMTVRPRSRATRCASPFCAHFDHDDSRWRVY